MKTRFLSLLIILFVFTGINNTYAENIKEERKVATFTGVDFQIAGEVFITQGAPQMVTVEGSADDIKDLKTEISGSTLIIKFEGWKMNYGDIKIYITAEMFNELKVSGSGSITAQSKITTENMELEVSGSGKIKIENLEVSQIEAEISGSGKIHIGGSKEANSMEFEISGSGDIYAEEIPVKRIEGDISGSGKASLNCTDKLEADISGSGKIYYKGNPQIDADISGSGSVRSSE